MPENTQIDNDWFKDQLAFKRMSQRKLASLMGLDPGAVSLMLRGKRKMSAKEVAEIARLLGVSVEAVHAHVGEANKRGASRSANERVVVTGQGGSGDFESEFMRKWLDLGFMLLRNRRP